MKAITILVFLLLPALSCGQIDPFKDGIALFKAEKYDSAITSLKSAYEKQSIIGDYILLYIAKAYTETKDLNSSSKSLDELLIKYPNTPIKRTAKRLLIKNTSMIDEEKALNMLEPYTRDYPDDEMKFLFARLIKGRDAKRAKTIFKELYISAGPYSTEAERELEDSDISVKDLIKRAENLISLTKYKEAELSMNALLSLSGKEAKNTANLEKDIFQTLALCLFKQKKYKEAGVDYLKAENYYEAGVSFMRAEEYNEFDSAVEKLLLAKDERAGKLLISSALTKRRKGDVKEALKLLNKVNTHYPSYAEESLWHKGWIYYLKRDYKGAITIFNKLSATYQDAKYLYWMARAIEKAGKDARDVYKELLSKNGFYSELGALRNNPNKENNIITNKNNKGNLFNKTSMEDLFKRTDTLLSAGLKDEAVIELLHMARGITDDREILNIAYKLRDMEEYKRAITLASNLPQDMRPDEILYPLAYWEGIEAVSKGYGIDPYLTVSIIREESRFDPQAYSPAGAIGIMQIMPETAHRLAKALKIRLNGNMDIYDVRVNINLGLYYLSSLLQEFRFPSPALAAYNAGEYRVREWLNAQSYESYDEFIEDIPYKETSQYIKRILTTYLRYLKYKTQNGRRILDPQDIEESPFDPFNLALAYGIIKK